jgi:hypothetical protein
MRSPANEDARRRRAEARRARVTIRRVGLLDDDPSTISGAEAVALLARLTRAAWTLSGRSLPRYSRGEIPCVFVPSSRLPS